MLVLLWIMHEEGGLLDMAYPFWQFVDIFDVLGL